MNVEEKRKKKHEKKVERNDHKTLKVFARAGMKKILSVCDSHSKTPRVPVEIFNRIFPSPTSWISRISFQRTVYERWGRDQGWYASCSLFNATWMRIHVGNGFLGWTTCFWNYKCQFFPSLVNSIFPNRRMRQQSINFSSKLLFQRIQIYLFVQRAEFLLSLIKIYSIVSLLIQKSTVRSIKKGKRKIEKARQGNREFWQLERILDEIFNTGKSETGR